MLLLNPHTLWDVGFQLSLAATLGLILYVEPLTRAFERLFARYTTSDRAQRIVGWLNDALIVTLAAQITTTGVIVGVFHRLSLVTLLTNILVLPAQSFLMLSGGVALIGGLIVRPIGHLLAWIAWVPLTYTITAVRWTATFPLASVELGNVTLPLVWGYYAVVGAVTWWFRTIESRIVRAILQHSSNSRSGRWRWAHPSSWSSSRTCSPRRMDGCTSSSWTWAKATRSSSRPPPGSRCSSMAAKTARRRSRSWGGRCPSGIAASIWSSSRRRTRIASRG